MSCPVGYNLCLVLVWLLTILVVVSLAAALFLVQVITALCMCFLLCEHFEEYD